VAWIGKRPRWLGADGRHWGAAEDADLFAGRTLGLTWDQIAVGPTGAIQKKLATSGMAKLKKNAD